MNLYIINLEHTNIRLVIWTTCLVVWHSCMMHIRTYTHYNITNNTILQNSDIVPTITQVGIVEDLSRVRCWLVGTRKSFKVVIGKRINKWCLTYRLIYDIYDICILHKSKTFFQQPGIHEKSHFGIWKHFFWFPSFWMQQTPWSWLLKIDLSKVINPNSSRRWTYKVRWLTNEQLAYI